MMRRKVLALVAPVALVAPCGIATPAMAQVSATNSGSAYSTTPATSAAQDVEAPPKPIDEGRFIPSDRDGLVGRGGSTATGRTYGATIGSTIGSTFDATIGSTLPLSQPR